MDKRIEVLVVGAGPTGLMLTALLARHGVPARLIEKNSTPSRQSKALGIHSRTLEILEDLGLLDEVLARGNKMHGVNLYASEKRIAHIAFDELEAPHPMVVALPQYDTEEILSAHLKCEACEIVRQVDLPPKS